MKVTSCFDFIYRMDFNLFCMMLGDKTVTSEIMLKVLLFLN
jgi:hypothetical protein